MADKYWVGADQNWHDLNNWSTVSGGAGGAGIPTSSDDVFFDGNGNLLCWPTSDIECNNMTLLTGMTELLLIDTDSAIIHGDFEQQDGYFGPTGGPDNIIEFKGNWLKTGGTFAVGTGVGKDPECIFSGITKTYNLNDTGAATYQNVLVSGEVIFSGTRLGVMNIGQKLSITGEMTVNANGLLICDVDLAGSNAGFDVFTGTLNGTGRLWYRYRSTHSMVATGTISIKYFLYVLQTASAVHNIPARTYEQTCTVEIEYTENDQVCRLESAARHFFMGNLTIYCDENPCDSELDFDTNTAEIWVNNAFTVDKDAFPNGTFTIKFGDGIHIFRHSVQFYFSYTSTTTHLVVDPGEGTIILYPKGLRQLVLPPPGRGL